LWIVTPIGEARLWAGWLVSSITPIASALNYRDADTPPEGKPCRTGFLRGSLRERCHISALDSKNLILGAIT
jgi:hypothetical protein